jgi:hypothetical protein
MSNTTWLTQMSAKLAELEAESAKFYEKGVKSSGPKARKILQDIKNLCQEGRTNIQDTTKSNSTSKAKA